MIDRTQMRSPAPALESGTDRVEVIRNDTVPITDGPKPKDNFAGNDKHPRGERAEKAKPGAANSDTEGCHEKKFYTPKNSDIDLSQRFADLVANMARYVSKWGCWLLWTGKHWQEDQKLAVFSRVKAFCREAAATANGNEANHIASAGTVAAIEKLSRSDFRVAATMGQWDADLWALNTPDGIVDLRSGRTRRAKPEDYCTKITSVAPGGNCPRWLQFLDEITDGDVEMVAFLQRALGYCLTGLTTEHALFFAYGNGANGKSVFLNVVSQILGPYHKVAPIETFTASKYDRHPTELAGLMGARFVTSIETEEGRAWAEAKIKTLTGGDSIAARFMRGDFFEFQPQFKLFIAGNHKPRIQNIDEAMRRRMHLIPFSVTIPPERRDPKLTETLLAEARGILAWMVDGCLEWQRIGLAPPVAVLKATAEYFADEDFIAAWIDECCAKSRTAWEGSTNLFRSWSIWASEYGEESHTPKWLAEQLQRRGFRRKKRTIGQGFEGLKIKVDASGSQ